MLGELIKTGITRIAMKTFKVSHSSADLPRLVQNIKTEADDKLRKFSIQQILDKQLSTKNFSYDFDLSNSRAGGQRKSVQKLKDIIFKAVKKRIVYLEYAKEELVSNGSQNSVFIKLVSPYVRTYVTPTSSIRTEDNTWQKALNRYRKYINYKCIKHGVPLKISQISFNSTLHPNDLETYRSLPREGASIRYCLTASFAVKLTLYSFSAYEAMVESYGDNNPLGIYSYDDFEKYLINKVKDNDAASIDTMKRYKDADSWNARDFPRRGTVRPYAGLEKYYAPEKVFLVLDEMQKVLMTLSRKTTYDTAAFNIGNSSNS
jgi:G:T/U-mismatch repair DNA glycosylase